MEFLEFPEGGKYWLIKWIDRYRLAHAASSSTSVDICLQEILIRDQPAIAKLTREQVGDLVRRPYPAEVTHVWAKVLTGFLPYLRIGQIYQNGKRVGVLSTETLDIPVPRGEESGRSIRLGQPLPPPENWTKSFRLLNPSQYALPYELNHSKCWVLKGNRNADIVIPRTLIEQTFYYPHSEMANAAATGAWNEHKKRLIFFGQLQSGLRTQVEPTTGEWQIILESKVPDQYAPLLALLNFDPYASQCANLLYTRALQERSSWLSPWHASGQLPFSPDAGVVRLRLRGHWLKSVPLKGSETFLATHIAGYTFPESLPDIAWERRNSGKGSDSPHHSPAPPPFRGAPVSQRGDPSRRVSSLHDGDPGKGLELFPGLDIEIIEGPKLRLLSKSSHQTYTEHKHAFQEESTDGVGSAGADSSRVDALRKVQLQSTLLSASVQFVELIKAMDALKEEGLLSHFYPVDPGGDERRVTRSGLFCWSFIDPQLRDKSLSRLPRKGWFIQNPGHSPPVLRAALVLELDVAGRTIHWIEIERRSTESGMGSPVLIDVPVGGVQSAIEYALQSIAINRGSGLRKLIHTVAANLGDSIGAGLFQHSYRREDKDGIMSVVGLNEAAVGRFLKRLTKSNELEHD